jgi:hypothetical protein
MTAEQAMAVIESTDFSVALNVVSDLHTFLRGAEQHPAVRALHEQLRSAGAAQQIAARIADLCQRPTDPAYENPGDAALAVYLWLLDRDQGELARPAAERVLQVPSCWWASAVARQVSAAGEPSEPAPTSLSGDSSSPPATLEGHPAPR